jgi:hypothetical protein
MAPPPPKPRGGHAALAGAMVLLDWPPDHLWENERVGIDELRKPGE